MIRGKPISTTRAGRSDSPSVIVSKTVMLQNGLIDPVTDPPATAAQNRPTGRSRRRRENFKRLRPFLMFTLLLALGFGKPLYDLARYAMDNDLYSHILLVPFVSF